MPSWNELLHQFEAVAPPAKAAWFRDKLCEAFERVGAARNDRNVILYASAFLQKPQAPPPTVSIQSEDLNGFMSVMHGMDWSKGLTLLMHTPGGVVTATETIVDYLRSKFTDFEVIVPTFSMSAGTMISLAADRIVMARHSQLGPIDPQLPMGARQVSARAVVDQFEAARTDILATPDTARVWAPILQSMGPALVQEAKNALDYGEQVVARWLTRYMLKEQANAQAEGLRIAKFFSDASLHKNHGRRIGRDEARAQGVIVDDLEPDPALQEAVLTAYHLFSMIADQTPLTKLIASRKNWFVKNYNAQLSGPGPATVPPRAAEHG